MPLALATEDPHEACTHLQMWLEQAMEADMALDSKVMPLLVAVPPAPARGAELRSLEAFAEGLQPLLFGIAGWAAASPAGLLRLAFASRSLAAQLEVLEQPLWQALYRRRWPAFHDCLRHHGTGSWRAVYRETLAGQRTCTLEVFEREKKVGFTMSAMPAQVRFDRAQAVYVAKYLSASQVMPEAIPLGEEHRLRFCPPSARHCIQGHLTADLTPQCSKKLSLLAKSYPYSVLEGVSGLEVGSGVELQWKMQSGSPFGWWYGTLEALRVGGNVPWVATVTFRHFPRDSRWYRLDVEFGDSQVRPCAIGGYSGGLRGVSEREQALWTRFFPGEPVLP